MAIRLAISCSAMADSGYDRGGRSGDPPRPRVGLLRSVATWAACALVLVAGLLGVIISGPPATAIAAGARPTVAILYFDYGGKNEELGALRKGLAQMMITDLADVQAVTVVERARLNEILDELKLGRS